MKNIKTFVILSGILIVLSISIIVGISFALPEGIENVTALTKTRIQAIRSTKNTSLVDRDENNIYYVSNSGDDSNDGKTPETAWKTISKVQSGLNNSGELPNGTTILFKRGDTFRGQLTTYKSDVLLGSYGDESKGKPRLYASPYDGTKTGEWVEVKHNIWKYTVNGDDQVFKKDVGQIWFFCNHSNSICNRTTTMGDIHYAMAQKKMTYNNVEESEDMLTELLIHDLDFYHMGHHSNNNGGTGGAIYVYSTSNPATRFDEIEFNLGGNSIGYDKNYATDLKVDNLEIRYSGKHGIGGGTTSNLYVTNCELSFIGGMVQKYDADGHWPIRLGNAVEVYGSITDKTITKNSVSNTYKVKKGLYVYNNYVYEVYDAGLTFQYTAQYNTSSPVERVEFDNNVVEYCSYNIEYWNSVNKAPEGTTANDAVADIDKTYMNKIYFTNNILRYAGMGFTETRPEHGYEALIKSWDPGSDSVSFNRLKPGGEFIIENNYFDTTGKLKDNQNNDVEIWMLQIDATNRESMPTIRHNKFYNYNGKNLGHVQSFESMKWAQRLITYDSELSYDNNLLKDNEFYAYNDTTAPTGTRNGASGETAWSLDLNNRTLTISGSGAMADYTESSLPPWYEYAKYIHTIIVGENVTKIGNYSFYNCKFVTKLIINSKVLNDFTGNNKVLYNLGVNTTGAYLEFGSEVTKVPALFTHPDNSSSNYAPNFTSIKFKGNKITTIGRYGLAHLHVTELKIPDSVTTIGNNGLYNNQALKVLVLSNNMTTLSNALLYNDTSLELVVLGEKITTCEANSLSNLKKLDTIVIPNENFIFPDPNTTTVINMVNTLYTFRIFGSSNLQPFVTLANTQVGYNMVTLIDLINYRPVIYGDGNTFYATYTEAYTNENVTFEAKALTTANVNITGAKYRYRDNQGHIHYMDGVNISGDTINNIQMDVELTGNLTNEVSKSIDDQNIVFLGNSLLVGYGNHGMASSTTKDDYYYYVTKYLKSLNSNIKTIKYGANTWEDYTSSESRNNETENFINYIKNNKNSNRVGTIFLQLGDNVNEDIKRVTFETDITYMINRLKEEFPDATIYYVFGRYNVATNVNIIERVVQNTNIKYIDISTLFTENKKSFRGVTPSLYSRYTSFIGDKYLDSEGVRRIVDAQGVGSHPGNYGFIAIADKIITYLKNDDYSIVDAITSDSYTIESMNIKATPVNKKLTRDVFISNLSSEREIRVYDRNDALVNTNDRIGTGYKVVSGNSIYHVVLKGDVNGDGQITLSDVSKLYNHYRGKITLTDYYLEAGKISNKSTVTLSDNARLYNYYKGKISTLG